MDGQTDRQTDGQTDVGHINLIGGLVTRNPPNKCVALVLFHYPLYIQCFTSQFHQNTQAWGNVIYQKKKMSQSIFAHILQKYSLKLIINSSIFIFISVQV